MNRLDALKAALEAFNRRRGYREMHVDLDTIATLIAVADEAKKHTYACGDPDCNVCGDMNRALAPLMKEADDATNL